MLLLFNKSDLNFNNECSRTFIDISATKIAVKI